MFNKFYETLLYSTPKYHKKDTNLFSKDITISFEEVFLTLRMWYTTDLEHTLY